MNPPEWFRALDAARIKRGHSVEAACAELQVGFPCWRKWAAGLVKTPIRGALSRIEEYVSGATKGP